MKRSITNIAGINVKGRNFRHQLKPVTIITGDNATGKTAITDAIIVAALGYHPALGKKAGATMQLAPDQATQMEVAITTSEGQQTRRTLTRTKSGASLETTGDTPPAIIPAQLHFADFIAAKPAERNAVLASLMGEIDIDDLRNRIATKAAELGIAGQVEIGIDPEADRPLDGAIADMAALLRGIKQTIDMTRKSIAAMLEENAEKPKTSSIPAGEIEQLEASLAEANGTVGMHSGELDRLSELEMKAPEEPETTRPTDSEIEQTRTELAEAEAELKLANHPDNTHRVQRIAAIERSLAALQGKARDNVGPVEGDAETIQGKIDTLTEQNAAVLEKLQAAREAYSANNREAQNIQGAIDQLVGGTCPTCGTHGDHLLPAIKHLEDKHDAIIDAVRGSEEEIKQQIEISDRLLAYKSGHQTQLYRRQAWEAAKEIEALQPELDALRAAEAKHDPRAAKARVEQAMKILADLLARKQQWDQYQGFTPPAPGAVEKAKKSHQEAVEARNAIAEKLGGMRASRAAHEAALLDQQRLVERQDQAEQDEQQKKRIGAMVIYLKSLQMEATATALKPLTETAGVFLKGVVEGQLAIRGHLVGIERDEAFLPLEVLSGMEMVAVQAACQAALARDSELPILIVDELARMTPPNRRKFNHNCHLAIEAGLIGQVILIDQDIDAHPADHHILMA